MYGPELRRNAATTRCAAVVLICGLAAALTPAGTAQAQVQWRTGTGAPPARLEAKSLEQRITGLAHRPDGNRRVVVYFSGPLAMPEREALEKAGLKLLTYLNGNAYFGTLDARTLDAPAVAKSPSIMNIDPVLRHWKLHPDLAAGIVQPWSITEPGKAGADAAAPDPVVAVYVLMHADADLQRDGVRGVLDLGGRLQGTLESINGLVVHVPFSKVGALADLDAVQWVEPPLPLMTTCNDDNRLRVGANIVQAAPYSLSGAGVTVLNYDANQMGNHGDFAGRLVLGAGDASGTAAHATHVGGTIGGSGLGDGGVHRGMAPMVHFVSYGLEQVGGLHQGFLYNDPCDIQHDFREAINTYGAHIDNSSIGTNTANNGYPCTWEGDYGVTDVLLDQIVRGGSLVPMFPNPFRVVWANGNERGGGGGRCGTQYNTTAPPACNKNVINVGALNSNDDSMTTFSSWGPADDGRLKPDVSAPGCQSTGDNGVTSCNTTSGYWVACGTSMASPTTCGVSSLVLQDYRANHPGAPDFRNSTLKILLAHSAVDLGNPGPDYQFGYGSVRAENAVLLERSNNFLENTVAGTGQSFRAVAVVNPGDTQLKITLAWDDYFGTPNVVPSLINDLDLVVTSPSGVRKYPFTLGGLANPSAPAVQTQENHKDNSEQVLVNNPEVGGWLIEVRGTNVPNGPQPFSLAATPHLVNCSDQGFATFDRPLYPCSGPLTMTVSDCGLNTSNSVVDTVNVTIHSTTQPVDMNVTLTEVAAAAATFTGTIQANTVGGAGVLRISPGDTITLTYVDANDGMGHTNVNVVANATVDCTPPVISAVTATNVQARSARLNFTTDEQATGALRYGTACGSLNNTAPVALGLTHFADISGLLPNTTYRFAADAQDQAGNSSTNNNGGQCFTFTTTAVPDFFTEDFSANNSEDLQGKLLTFTPNGSPSFYRGCTTAITALPTDPAGGTALSFTNGDDGFNTVTLTGGRSVSLYGASYTTMYVGTNGYITFDSGDTDYTETLADHFGHIRVAAMFDDLLPGNTAVSYRVLADHIAVTWNNCPHYGNAEHNTFQIEFFTDGRIRMAYTLVQSHGSIAGLSRGTGLDPDFGPTDLSTMNSCTPPCACDWNHDGGISSQDFFDFTTAFFANNADFNGDHVTNSQDFFDFLTCFFAGCP